MLSLNAYVSKRCVDYATEFRLCMPPPMKNVIQSEEHARACWERRIPGESITGAKKKISHPTR